MKNVYSVLSYYNHTYGVKDIAAKFYYVAPLNFYRKLSGRETIAEFISTPVYPAFDRAFIVQHGLKVVYHDKRTDVLVAIRPEVESRKGALNDP